MVGKEYLIPQTSFSIEQLSQLREEDFTERIVTFEYRRTNGVMIMARKGDHITNKLTQRQLAEAAQVPSRVINLIETLRGYPTPEVAEKIAEVLNVKKELLFPPGLRAYERNSSQPAKLRILLTGEETKKSSRLANAFLLGSEEDETFMDNLILEAREKRPYFLEVYNRHGLTTPVDVMLVMDTPDMLITKSRALYEFGRKKWALDLLNLTENRVVFMYNKEDRNKLETIAKNPNIETDDDEILRLRKIYNLEDLIKSCANQKKRRKNENHLMLKSN